mgnify:FL=1
MKKKKRLDQILVERGSAGTRAKAQAIIMSGEVYVEGKQILKSGLSFLENSKIIIKDKNKEWVSRGSYKLLKALENFDINIENKICLDLGSSTGGFTHVLLSNKAKKIYAVDVGTNQLHEKLLNEKKIISIEKTNARYLNRKLITDNIDVIVCDVSFISVKKIIKPNLCFLKNNSIIIILIKPQFEANKKEIKKGVVRDPNIHNRICEDIKTWLINECKSKIIGLVESPIKGPKGNIEFLVVAKYYK